MPERSPAGATAATMWLCASSTPIYSVDCSRANKAEIEILLSSFMMSIPPGALLFTQGGLYYPESRCKVELTMKAMRQFALMLAVLLPLLVPVMACTLPSAHMSATENACCRQMKGQCGSMAMPASHGCCHKEVPTASHWNAAVQANSTNIQINFSTIAGLPSSAIFTPLPVVLSKDTQRSGSTLPQSPPTAISILRI